MEICTWLKLYVTKRSGVKGNYFVYRIGENCGGLYGFKVIRSTSDIVGDAQHQRQDEKVECRMKELV